MLHRAGHWRRAMPACGAIAMLYVLCNAVTAVPARGPSSSAPAGNAALGQRLFLGRVPLEASMRGEMVRLPASASRCINCHGVPVRQPAAGLRRALTASAAIDLQTFTSRRGGPAFAYDAGSMCLTLRTGIDPQQIWLARAMPQFRLTSTECAALWAYLTQPAQP